MRKTTVAVLCGGISGEREISLASGEAVAKSLDPERYEVRRYDPAGDLPHIVAEVDELDIALIMLHGRGGEDGCLQGFLDLLGLPYQGSGVLGSAMAMDKSVSKQLYRAAGLRVAPDVVLRRGMGHIRERVQQGPGLPAVVKPSREGSSLGVTIVQDEDALAKAVNQAFGLDEVVLVEAFLPGRELTCAVLGNQDLEALPLVEILPGESYQFFDYEAKYKPGATREVCPAPLEREVTFEVQEMAKAAHRVLRLDGYSRSDFILSDKGPVILETNTIPGMTQTSLLPQAAAEAGLSFADLVERLIALAIERRSV